MENNPLQEKSFEASPVTGTEVPPQYAPPVQNPAPVWQPQPNPNPQPRPYGVPQQPGYPPYGAPQQPGYPPRPYCAPQPPMAPPADAIGQKDIYASRGLAICSFVFGILGMILCMIPVLNFILSIVAIVCASIALKKGGAVSKAHAGAGLTTGILAFLGALGQVIIVSAITRLINQITSFGGMVGEVTDIIGWIIRMFGGY